MEELQGWRAEVVPGNALLLSLGQAVDSNDWLEEELVGNLAELIEGLRVGALLLVQRFLDLEDEALEEAGKQDDEHAVLVHFELRNQPLDFLP